jgi:hypothetical protein
MPPTVSAAAAMFVAYAAAVLLNAIAANGELGWSDAGDSGWTVLRIAGALLIAWGLFKGARWAWWVGLVLAAVCLVGAALAVVVLERGDLHWLQPSGSQLFMTAGMLSLGIAVALLLTRSARSFFGHKR